MDILSLLTSTAGGGIVGGIFSAIKLFGAYKEKKLMAAHELSMAKEDRETMKLEIEASKHKSELQLEQVEVETDARALTAAINAESQSKANTPWVQDFKSLTRPVLTYMLVLMAFGISIFATGNPHAAEINFLAATAVTFWFVIDRGG